MTKPKYLIFLFSFLFGFIKCTEKPVQTSYKVPTLKKLKAPSTPDTIAARLCNCGQKMLQIKALARHSTSDYQRDSLEKVYQLAMLDYNMCMENENIPALKKDFGRIDSAYMKVQREMLKICPALADTSWGGMETEEDAPVRHHRRRWHHRRRR